MEMRIVEWCVSNVDDVVSGGVKYSFISGYRWRWIAFKTRVCLFSCYVILR